jgi:hypothetical protein
MDYQKAVAGVPHETFVAAVSVAAALPSGDPLLENP